MKAPQYCPYAGIHTVRPELGELFAGRKITQDEKFWEYLNQYDVIFLNMQQFLIEGESGETTKYLEQDLNQYDVICLKYEAVFV